MEAPPVFARIVVLDWYDGFLEGFAGDPATRRAWAVRTLAWDEEGLDWRLMGAAPVAWEALEEAAALFGGPLAQMPQH